MNLEGLRHIAIIMDGNGRWAQKRGMGRTRGHRAGVTAVRETVTACARDGLERLTLFALSTENLRTRPESEVSVLMALLRRFVVKERPTLLENDIRLTTIGRLDEIPDRVVAAIRETERLTQGHRGMVLTLAINYGGRAEIVDAARRLAMDVAAGRLDPGEVDEASFNSYVYDPAMPDVDMMIRTGGEQRLSNFLLWKLHYGELYVTPTLWPDFRVPDLEEAVAAYGGRRRRFGGLMGVDR